MVIDRIPVFVKDICESLNKAGFEAYMVGGSIRDIIMDLETSDFDIATNALPTKYLRSSPGEALR